MFLELTMYILLLIDYVSYRRERRDEFRNSKIIWFCWAFPILWVARKEVVIASVNCVSRFKIKVARWTLHCFAVILGSFNSEIEQLSCKKAFVQMKVCISLVDHGMNLCSRLHTIYLLHQQTRYNRKRRKRSI